MSAFSAAVLAWYDQHGRTHLPWQQQITPYRVWVSEIMLQQTQVATVIGYFERFMSAFPTVSALAAANEDAVLHLWAGLGYYSRARNLHRSAGLIMSLYQGQLPTNLTALMMLPGIGRSTAGAIASLSMGLRAPILDANVQRVLSRFLGISELLSTPAVQKKLWQTAEALMPEQRIAAYTQAMMDLGATVCTSKDWRCTSCPLVVQCQTHRAGMQASIPARKLRQELPHKHAHMLLMVRSDQQAVLLYKRPSQGIWGGLWSFPECADMAQSTELLSTFQLSASSYTELAPLKHRFTHFQLTIQPWIIYVDAKNAPPLRSDWLWYTLARSAQVGLAAPVKKILKRAITMMQHGDQHDADGLLS